MSPPLFSVFPGVEIPFTGMTTTDSVGQWSSLAYYNQSIYSFPFFFLFPNFQYILGSFDFNIKVNVLQKKS
jgi:hypothetical protein